MFQPTPTPFFSYQVPTYGVPVVANANVPDYTFAPTPLSAFDRDSSRGAGGSGSGGSAISNASSGFAGLAGPNPHDANVYASPIFEPPPANHRAQQFSYDRAPPSHLASHNYTYLNLKMEQDDIAAQEAAARDYAPELKVRTTPAR
jgi:ubiquitin thioesterase protein OTUB1